MNSNKFSSQSDPLLMDLQSSQQQLQRHTQYSLIPVSIPVPVSLHNSINKQYTFIFSLFVVAVVATVIITSVVNPKEQPLLGINFLPIFRQNGVVSQEITCDYSKGKWIWDETYPYTWLKYNESCKFLDPGFQCHQNGRINQSFRHWRWQPHGCDLPRFNASDFLERSRNGRIVFAGDSIGRNQWESLLCMLSMGVSNQSTIYEANGVPITRHKGFFKIKFQEFNLSVEYYRTPFLVRVGRSPPKSPGQVRGTVKIDKLHWFSEKWVGGDVFVFNAGHWWNDDKTIASGLYFQEGEAVNVSMHFTEAFKRSLQTWKAWVEHRLNPQRSHIFFRSYAPVHYRNGTWSTGGSCRNNNAPETNTTKLMEEPRFNQYILDVVKEMKAEKMKVNMLNITYLSEFRSDGHLSIHRAPGASQPSIEDCSHWCLPGVPDTWNELLYSQLLAQEFRTT